jgi:hypothetical protein
MKQLILFLSPMLLIASPLWSQPTSMDPRGNIVWSPVPNNPVPSINDQPAQIGPMSQQIKEHPKLAGRIQLLLPTGGHLQETCSAFEALSDCVAALHASANVNIDFWRLNALMNSGPRAHWVSLKTAIRELGLPRSTAKAEAKKAKAQAKQDMKLSR